MLEGLPFARISSTPHISCNTFTWIVYGKILTYGNYFVKFHENVLCCKFSFCIHYFTWISLVPEITEAKFDER
jgi:hypothetical protein